MENKKYIESIGQAYKQVQEKLKGGQKKLDKDGDGDIDGTDFAMMRKKKKMDEADYDSKDDHNMDPTSHVQQNKDTGMFCVYNMKNKKVAEFKTKAEADAYAKKNHDDLMKKEQADSEVSEDYGAMKDAEAHAKKDGKNYKDVSVQHKYDAYHMKKRGYTHFEPGSYGTRKYHKRPVAGGTKISGDHHSGVSEQNELAPKGMKMKKPNEQNELAPKGMKKKMGEDEVVMNPKKKKQTGEKAANSDSNMAQEDTKWPIYNRIMEKNVVNQNAVAPEQMIPADKKLKDDQSDVVNQSQDHISAAAAQWIKDHDGNQVPADAVDHEKVVAKNAQDAMRTVPNQAKDEVNKKAGKPENMTVTKEKK